MAISTLEPGSLPKGAFGFRQRATTRASVVVVDMVYAPVKRGDQQGILMIRTATTEGKTSPQDAVGLLNKALHRANAHIDPDQLTAPAQPTPTSGSATATPTSPPTP
ncbi:hypothetical protein ACSAM2_01515 [Actinomyces oris]|uniref:hypothetical protein n=1 Tax=Actinomyces TaxID=1654 RepID=UPI0011472F08|nr:hypothetical protein [Actinomyces oris]